MASGVATFQNSIVEGSGGSGAWNPAYGVDAGGNLAIDPLFVSPPFTDLRLQSTSPAVDAGVTVPGLPVLDLDVQARVIGAEVDMGPYEYNPFTGIVDDEPETPEYQRRFAAYPNPFNPTLTVAFELEVAGRVELAVYNVAGKRVRTLAREHRPAGRHEVSWDATGDNGSRAASGVYVVRIVSGSWQETRKVVLLK